MVVVLRWGTRLLWWICGLIGDRGATTRAPSGESGVRHCSLAGNKRRRKWFGKIKSIENSLTTAWYIVKKVLQ
jgi:hypothetical protein